MLAPMCEGEAIKGVLRLWGARERFHAIVGNLDLTERGFRPPHAAVP
jgi:hypothetical protein